MPRCLVRNEPDHQPGAVVHPALAAQLAHGGVHERVAGAALAPGLEALLGVAPRDRAAVALLELRARVAREVAQHVVVEVAPAQLAPERLGSHAARAAAPRSRAARHSRSAGRARDARSCRGRARRGCRVSRTCRRRKRREPLAGGALAAAAGARRSSCSSPSSDSDGMRPLARPPGSDGSLRGRPTTSRRGILEPGAVEGTEDRVGLARSGADARSRSSTACRPGWAQLELGRSSARQTRSMRRRANGPDVGAEVDLPRARARAASAASSCSGGPCRITSCPSEPLARSSRHSSRNCVRGPEAWRPCSRRSSKQKTGTTRFVGVERSAQRRMVVDAQVTCKPEEGGHTGDTNAAAAGWRPR